MYFNNYLFFEFISLFCLYFNLIHSIYIIFMKIIYTININCCFNHLDDDHDDGENKKYQLKFFNILNQK